MNKNYNEMKQKFSPAMMLILMIAIGLTMFPLRGVSQTYLDLLVEKAANTYEPAVGSQVVFTITVTNLSHVNNATGVEVEDILDSGFEYISSSATIGSYNSVTGVWGVGTVNADQTQTLEITVKVLTQDRVCNAALMTAVDQSDTNGKNDKFTICLNPTAPEELDLAVAKDVYNAVPPVGGQSVFTITVTNLSATVSATNVEIEDILDANFVYQYSSVSTGSYDSGTGIWSIPVILPSQTVTMDMTVTVNGSADNTARLKSLDQTDTNPNNNEDMVSVTVSGSSGGNNGGLESNGSLAAKIAVRNYNRSKTDQKSVFSNPSQMIAFSEDLARNRIITAAGQLKGGSGLAELFPEEGPFGSKAFVSTPEDLLGITNASEVFSVDYYSNDKRMGAILAMTTLNGEVYGHTKMVCDRMSGGSLDLVKNVQINDQSFILSKLVQTSGDVDYAISFIAWEQNGVLMIDNRWNIADYEPAKDAMVQNFQVWSVTAQSTIELARELLARMADENELTFLNTDDQLPGSYAANGYYENGNIIINLRTNGQADELHIQGKLTRNEGAISEPFSYDINVPAKSEGLVNIEIPLGNVFDAGFSLTSDQLEINDVLYFADGPWGNSFEDDGAWINSFTTEPYDGQQFADTYLLERNAEMSGQVRTYASLFRALKAGNQSVDLTGYNVLQFEASGYGNVELIVAKASIEQWSDQARTMFTLSAEEKTISIDLSQLKAGMINNSGFSAEDVLSVAFNLIGDGQNWQDFSISVKNLRFAKGSSDQILTDQDEIKMNAYPNPVSNMATIEFSIPETNHVHIALYDITGKEVQVIADQEFSFGTHRLQLSADGLSNGMYFMKLRYNHQVESQRISVLK